MNDQPEPEQKKEHPAPAMPDIELPKLPAIKDIPSKLKRTLQQYARVFKITKKPTTEEYKTIVKVSGIGILLIGAIGFIVYMIIQLLERV